MRERRGRAPFNRFGKKSIPVIRRLFGVTVGERREGFPRWWLGGGRPFVGGVGQAFFPGGLVKAPLMV